MKTFKVIVTVEDGDRASVTYQATLTTAADLAETLRMFATEASGMTVQTPEQLVGKTIRSSRPKRQG